LKSRDTDLPSQFVIYRVLRQRLNKVKGENTVKPIAEAIKFSANAQYNVPCA